MQARCLCPVGFVIYQLSHVSQAGIITHQFYQPLPISRICIVEHTGLLSCKVPLRSAVVIPATNAIKIVIGMVFFVWRRVS